MWIKESAKKGRGLKDMYNLNGVDVYIKDRLPEDIDPDFIFNYISARIPFHLARSVDIIYIGYFPEMDDREVNAYYQDGAIYITNQQDGDMDMIDDIIHEIAHAVEQNHDELIYGSGSIQREFIAKRKRLTVRLQQISDVPEDFEFNIEWDREIDDFLYKGVGYDILNQLVVNIFPSAYAATSINEYFARGFEEYFIGDKESLRKTCPVLYKKIDELVHLED